MVSFFSYFFNFFWFFFVFQCFVKASDVLNLDEASFKQTIQQSGIFLVEFFAPWCGHCKALAPEYETAATLLKDKGITLIQIDCTVETRLCEAYDVSGYPTLKIFRDGQHSPYEGPRKANAIVSFMIKQTLPVTTDVDHDNFELFKTSDEIVVLALLDNENKEEHDIYHKLAETYRNKYVFGVTSSANIAKELKTQIPNVVMFKKFDEALVVFDKAFKYETLEAFINSESVPLLGELRPDTYEKYISTKVPLGCIFVSSDEEKEHLKSVFISVAKKYKGRLNFATIDGNLYGGHAENLNLKQEWPAFAIQETNSNKKYPFDQTKSLELLHIEEFLDDYFSSRLSPSIKSEPIPETQGPVAVVVANSFKEMVIESKKDVLLEFYAPWCGHCKNLAPKYELLGQVFSSPHLSSKVMIAKIDATANDIEDNLDVRGFPTIFLFPAHDKQRPVEYNGPRTVEGLIEFIMQKGSHRVDASKEYIQRMKDKTQESQVPEFEHDEL